MANHWKVQNLTLRLRNHTQGHLTVTGPENHLFHKGNYHCMAVLLVYIQFICLCWINNWLIYLNGVIQTSYTWGQPCKVSEYSQDWPPETSYPLTSVTPRSDAEEDDDDEPENKLRSVVEKYFEQFWQNGEFSMTSAFYQSVETSEEQFDQWTTLVY